MSKMKARINPQDRISKKKLAEAKAVAKDMVWKERHQFARRIFKLWAYVNHDEYGIAAVRGMRAINRINWFVDEQVEEEESAREKITTFEAVEGNKNGM